MTAKEILTPIITQEFQKYQSLGYKIRLKTTAKKRLKYTAYCALGAILCWPVAIIVYIVLMAKTSNVNTILALAKEHPDVPVDYIIAQEMKMK